MKVSRADVEVAEISPEPPRRYAHADPSGAFHSCLQPPDSIFPFDTNFSVLLA